MIELKSLMTNIAIYRWYRYVLRTLFVVKIMETAVKTGFLRQIYYKNKFFQDMSMIYVLSIIFLRHPECTFGQHDTTMDNKVTKH